MTLAKKLSDRRINVGFPEDIWDYLDKTSAYEARPISNIIMGIVIGHVRTPSDAKPVVMDKPVKMPEEAPVVAPKPAPVVKAPKPKPKAWEPIKEVENTEEEAPEGKSYPESGRMNKEEYAEAIRSKADKYIKNGRKDEDLNMFAYEIKTKYDYSIEAVLYDFYKVAGLDYRIKELPKDIIKASNDDAVLMRGEPYDPVKDRRGRFGKKTEEKNPSTVKALEKIDKLTPEDRVALMDSATIVKHEK